MLALKYGLAFNDDAEFKSALNTLFMFEPEVVLDKQEIYFKAQNERRSALDLVQQQGFESYWCVEDSCKTTMENTHV